MITEQQALEIAKEVGYPTFDGAPPAKEFTSALNLAAAEACIECLDPFLMKNSVQEHIKKKAQQYREAAK